MLTGLVLLACTNPLNIKQSFSSDLEEICFELELDCSEIPEPIVVISNIVPTGYYGLYLRGEPYVFISSRASLEQIRKTIYHETVHYVQVNAEPTIGRCESEEAARKLTAKKFGYDYDEEWRERYRC